MFFLLVFLFGLTLIYTIIIFFISLGLLRIPSQIKIDRQTVSVIVAARNEENNIQALLNALESQDYPQDKLSIIIVDDMSTDGTYNIVSDYKKSFQNLKLQLN